MGRAGTSCSLFQGHGGGAGPTSPLLQPRHPLPARACPGPQPEGCFSSQPPPPPDPCLEMLPRALVGEHVCPAATGAQPVPSPALPAAPSPDRRLWASPPARVICRPLSQSPGPPCAQPPSTPLSIYYQPKARGPGKQQTLF
ncbi:adenosine receptor A2b-like [Platysternon megacephalum]|uniref:Adenosine receptor A2b-like n=1 Tax=Platysternon megacephalum TaxID=55544 RepID=A0A4D9DSL9_9SAUR|nr:adenosine receptor A2b-like [Platysternon megacephalum]